VCGQPPLVLHAVERDDLVPGLRIVVPRREDLHVAICGELGRK